MLREMREKGVELREDHIEVVQRRMEIQLPRDYRQFLLQFNGGRPVPSMFPINGFLDNPVGRIQVFFGIKYPVATANLEFVWEENHELVPVGIIPIACTEGYDFLCLDLRNCEIEKVVFWDRRHFWGSEEWREQDIYQVVKTFSSLLEALQDDHPNME